MDRPQDFVQNSPQPVEDEAEVVAGGGENGIGVVAGSFLEVIAVEVAVGLEVSDDRFDGRTPAQLLLDDTVNATFLSRSVDPERLGRVVTAVALVDLGALDLGAGQRLSLFDHGRQRGTIPRAKPEGRLPDLL